MYDLTNSMTNTNLKIKKYQKIWNKNLAKMIGLEIR